MHRIRVAIVGIGNCASALIQGLSKASAEGTAAGAIHPVIGGYGVEDIEIVCAFDVDKRKVGRQLREAIFAAPNNARRIWNGPISFSDVAVRMGKILDGIGPHMQKFPEEVRFAVASNSEPSASEVVDALVESKADVLINYLPVGSEKATRFYMECALEARVGVVNCIPVFIASDTEWESRFAVKGVPIVGDDIKSQFGATIVHRTLSELCHRRGVAMNATYQLNVGGNSDFMNMLDRERLSSKKISKTKAVTSALGNVMPARQVHVGPSDYVPWLNDNKICFIKMQGELFGGAPWDLELRLSVEDSPNSAGVVVDAIRYCKLALDREIGGAVLPACASLMKHPPQQMSDFEAEKLLQEMVDSSKEAM